MLTVEIGIYIYTTIRSYNSNTHRVRVGVLIAVSSLKADSSKFHHSKCEHVAFVSRVACLTKWRGAWRVLEDVFVKGAAMRENVLSPSIFPPECPVFELFIWECEMDSRQIHSSLAYFLVLSALSRYFITFRHVEFTSNNPLPSFLSNISALFASSFADKGALDVFRCKNEDKVRLKWTQKRKALWSRAILFPYSTHEYTFYI